MKPVPVPVLLKGEKERWLTQNGEKKNASGLRTHPGTTDSDLGRASDSVPSSEPMGWRMSLP